MLHTKGKKILFKQYLNFRNHNLSVKFTALTSSLITGFSFLTFLEYCHKLDNIFKIKTIID